TFFSDNTFAITAKTELQISCAVCSTQPDSGKYCENSCCAVWKICPSLSNKIARVLVVPWSIAKIYCSAMFILLQCLLILYMPFYKIKTLSFYSVDSNCFFIDSCAAIKIITIIILKIQKSMLFSPSKNFAYNNDT